ncbi:MAG: transcription antitermination factor NusB [Phycisphaerales bacterium]
MATPRDIRRLAFQTLFQLDARGGGDAEAVLLSLVNAPEFTDPERQRAFDLASDAFDARAAADAEFLALAPAWPTHRQPAADRAILRLAHFEITAARVAPKIAINEAVELAKEFGTDRSPAFVNGLLDKVLKRVAARPAAPAADAPALDISNLDAPASDAVSPPTPAEAPHGAA